MSSSISAYARNYAEALDRLEAARNFMKMLWPHRQPVLVTWSHGAALTGYRELADEVSKLVSQQMPELLQQALANLDIRVAEAHGQLNDAAHLGARGRMRASDLPEEK